jgi:glycosyltransferase involved in cell wall biosynthesis
MTDKIFVISMVKDEDDIIQYILDHMLTQEVDHFIIADNMSTDNTRLILDSFAERYDGMFTILDDNEPGYYQSAKMNGLAQRAASMGADIILPMDADECWLSANPFSTVGEALRTMSTPVTLAAVWDMVPQPLDSDTGNPLVDTVYREPGIKSLPSVAYRYEEGSYLHQGNHGVSRSGDITYDVLAVRHFQYRSENQLIRKLRQGKQAYDATDLSQGEGYHWRSRGDLPLEELKAQWNQFINQPGLVYDPTPLRRAR